MILESVPRDMPLGAASTGSATEPAEELAGMLGRVYEHERRMAAVAVTVLADEKLHARFREILSRVPGGPEDFTRAVASALRSYADAGVVGSTLDPDAAAAFVQGRCFHHAVLDRLHGPGDAPGAPAAVVDELLAFLTG
ncbi:hypothetical protein C8E95_1869 [Pseudonocardia autotrophica]|uniref:Tetracyclin repressor-like C-terminal domain-containing protein n=2 Tax=Pseudonocardia TaxID=1847 RepID=A0A1Y2MWV5_PSEAH|nr:hypothetical protein BG845_03271 [Pseudonocardia autotrophica]TDN72805.1 hypothetical protein C8E95_1869 [Pseudonocardia autotrophica]